MSLRILILSLLALTALMLATPACDPAAAPDDAWPTDGNGGADTDDNTDNGDAHDGNSDGSGIDSDDSDDSDGADGDGTDGGDTDDGTDGDGVTDADEDADDGNEGGDDTEDGNDTNDDQNDGQGDEDDANDDDDAGDDDLDGDAQTLALFDEVWETFDANYSYFDYKDINWDAVRENDRPRFSQALEPEPFAAELGNVLTVLHDWHVAVVSPEGQAYGPDEPIEVNFPARLLPRYTPSQQGYEQLGNAEIYHSIVGDNLGYIVIDSFENGQFGGVTGDDVRQLLESYADTDGLIIDIRNNAGGNEANATLFTSRFVDEPVDFGYVRYRNGPDHDDFDPLITKTLEPAGDFLYDGWLILLIGQRCMSSAEWFTLQMRAAGAMLMGDTTRGASGSPAEFTLANGVTYYVSTWIAYDDALEPFEDVGIEPDPPFEMAPAASYDDDRDYLLELAIETLEPF